MFSQQPAPPAWEQPLAALESLLADPRPGEPLWRARLFSTLTRLEHAPPGRVLPGWEALAAGGSDRSLANLVLYQRRHELPLEPVGPREGPETRLERCLAAWGAGDRDTARVLLEEAVRSFPADPRFEDNLRWLDLRPPQALDLAGSSRRTALAVITARRSRN